MLSTVALPRHPPSVGFLLSNNSCFTSACYELRNWQQIGAVKKVSEMRLSLNGEPTALNEDSARLAKGLKVLVSRLDKNRDYRRFVTSWTNWQSIHAHSEDEV